MRPEISEAKTMSRMDGIAIRTPAAVEMVVESLKARKGKNESWGTSESLRLPTRVPRRARGGSRVIDN